MASGDLVGVERIAIRWISCPRCAGAMFLARTRPVRIGYDMQTFEGVDCNHIHKVVVASDATP